MLTEVCDFVHNYFEHGLYEGAFVISDGTVEGISDLLANGQRFRIRGSALNDGIYTYQDGRIYDDDGVAGVVLKSETFTGTITAMAVPVNFLSIVKDIAAWKDKNQTVLDSPYTSESFGGYSYTKATGSGANAGGVLGWQDVFKSRLNAYRRIA